MIEPASGEPTASDSEIGFMNGLDALFLYLESPETPMHVGSLHRFGEPAAGLEGLVDALRGHLASRLHHAAVFTRRLASMPLGLANPAWVTATEVDLTHHVRRVALPAPGGAEQLHDLVASLHARLLDRSRPLWEMWVIEGLAEGGFAFYAKVHHAGLDGQAGVALAQAVYSFDARGAEPWPAAPTGPIRIRGATPSAARVAAAGVRHNVALLRDLGGRLPGLVRSVRQVIRPEGDARRGGLAALIGGDGLLAPRTPLNVALSRRRAFSTVSVPIERVRAVAELHQASINDVLLAAVGDALRGWLASRGSLPRASLLAAMPVSLRRAGDERANTQAMMARVTLATDIADPIERLHRIRDASAQVKGVLREVKSVVPTEFPSLGLPWIGELLAAVWGRARLANRLPPLANVVVSNVPGPERPLSLLGATMRAYWPVSIPYHGMALNITVQSYAGSLDVGLIACRDAVPDLHEITRRLEVAFASLLPPSTAHRATRRASRPSRNQR